MIIPVERIGVRADGSVHFMEESMDLRVLAALCTREGGELVIRLKRCELAMSVHEHNRRAWDAMVDKRQRFARPAQ